jgi:hypothetical protein
MHTQTDTQTHTPSLSVCLGEDQLFSLGLDLSLYFSGAAPPTLLEEARQEEPSPGGFVLHCSPREAEELNLTWG